MLFLARLKTGLSAIENNFNQAVKRLHTVDRIPENKAQGEVE